MKQGPILTLFTSPKSFQNPHIATIQRNAIQSWVELGDQVEVVLLGEEEGTEEVAREFKVKYMREIARNQEGTPLISALFNAARTVNHSPLLAYVNADIILLPDFHDTITQVRQLASKFLLVGQRWDLDIREPLDFSTGWQQRLVETCLQAGKLHKPAGSDYFVFPRECFTVIPDFAIGRAGWDNWMIYESRCQGWKVVDCSKAIRVIHQKHDYYHLPGGQAHYHLPETATNIRLAGGKRHIFMLQDANFIVKEGRLQRVNWTGKHFLREIEVFPLVKLHSETLGNLVFSLFHPYRAYAEYKKKQREQVITMEQE